jgi:hypothetical protein
MGLGISRMSGRELGISRRFWSDTELGISRKFEQELELSISQQFEAGREQALEHQQLGSGLKPGLSQRHHHYLAPLPVRNPSRKMEGTVAASVGHTSCCSFKKSEKKTFIKTVR